MSKYTQAITEAIAKVSEERNNKKFNWTEDAILCKLRGCNCKGCKFDELHAFSYENKKHGCRLKKTRLKPREDNRKARRNTRTYIY